LQNLFPLHLMSIYLPGTISRCVAKNTALSTFIKSSSLVCETRILEPSANIITSLNLNKTLLKGADLFHVAHKGDQWLNLL